MSTQNEVSNGRKAKAIERDMPLLKTEELKATTSESTSGTTVSDTTSNDMGNQDTLLYGQNDGHAEDIDPATREVSGGISAAVEETEDVQQPLEVDPMPSSASQTGAQFHDMHTGTPSQPSTLAGPPVRTRVVKVNHKQPARSSTASATKAPPKRSKQLLISPQTSTTTSFADPPSPPSPAPTSEAQSTSHPLEFDTSPSFVSTPASTLASVTTPELTPITPRSLKRPSEDAPEDAPPSKRTHVTERRVAPTRSVRSKR